MDYLALKAANRASNDDEARRGVTRLTSKPLYFWFDIYGPCNLKCVHCGFNKDGRTSDQEVSERVYQMVMDELMPTAYVCHLGGTNWGEMTISKNFQRFLLDCKKHDVKVSLTTNGTRMNDSWFNDLLDTLTVIGFSMEGMHEEFEKIRGFPWKRFRENVEKLVQGKRDRGKTFRVEWRYCAHADSIHQLPDMIRTAKEIGIDRIQVMTLVPYVRSQKFKNLSYHRSLANRYFREGRALAHDLGIETNIPDDFNIGDFSSSLIKLQHKSEVEAVNGHAGPRELDPYTIPMVECFKPWQACSINELGNVKPCCVYWRSMGDLSTHGFDQVWNGAKYRRLRRSINTKPDAICHGCRMPLFDSEDGKVANELRPGYREILASVKESLLHRKKVAFGGVLDAHLDPKHPGAESGHRAWP